MSVAPDKVEQNNARLRGLKAIAASFVPALTLNTIGRTGFDEVILGNVYRALSKGGFELAPSDIAIGLGCFTGPIDLLVGDKVESKVGKILHSRIEDNDTDQYTLIERGVMMLARFGVDFGLSLAIVNGLAALSDSI